MKKQLAVRIGMWMCIAVLAVGTLATRTIHAAPALAVVGDWDGALSAGGGSLPVVIHITQEKEGKLAATLDSPSQGATGIAISPITFKEPDVHFEIEKFGATYDGTMNKNHSEIAGTWKQGGQSMPLNFKRSSK